ncbi:MAG: phytoene desaturase [Tabrizicola sp.]|uniref:phytoene desaturase n=1 Tax=Tabrizicola sp. TaxID=2005166 RepID=UPI002732ECBC|nr:phytoene desaturase [Tabrizicola sp.]MDP3265130.1 phytoene desaturase [Tabrizicola sp.]MDP3646898.1 phytoene desaturase [Paracoccaceae bacterium]MDZ4068249.1 phytoene desaturase [Tabrizicola sp.]
MFKRTAPPRANGTSSDASHAIVIGAGLGGLASAMRLGAKGYRVTVIDRLDRAGGRGSSITQGGHRFDLGPTIVTVPQILRELWAACGRDFDRDVALKPMDPFYEIRFQDGETFTMRGDAAAMKAEVARISPSDAKGYATFLKGAEARYRFGFEDLGRRPMHKFRDLVKVLPTFAWYRADRSVHAHAAARVKDEHLRFALSFHPLFIGGDPFKVTSMYALVSHLEAAFGVHYAMGGVQAIADAMVRVIEAQGGEVVANTEVDEVVVAAGRAAGVRLVSGEVLPAGVVVSNADAGHTYDRLLRNAPKRRWTPARLRRTRWSMGLYVWYFGTAGTSEMWKDVGHHSIVVGPRYREHIKDIFIRGKLADDMSLYVHRPSVTDPSVAPKGGDTFYALSPVPHLGHGGVNWAEEEPKYRAKMAAMLEERLIPGFQKHITESLVFTPDTFRDRYLSPYGAGFSIEPRILQSAWFRPHNVSEELPGLYLTGAGTHPGAGVPGVIGTAEVLGKLVPDAAVRWRAADLPLAAE